MRTATLVLGILMFALTSCIKEHPPIRGSLTVLILLDDQRDYLSPQGSMAIAQDQVEPLLKATNAMISAMQQQTLPVIYVLNQFSPFDVLGDFQRSFAALRFEPGQTLDTRINDVAGVYFTKTGWSAFANPQFDEHLQLIRAGHLVLSGTEVEHSVFATARDAIRRGYQVTVISDAVANSDAQRRDAALQQLRQAGAHVETSDQFIASLTPGQSSSS